MRKKGKEVKKQIGKRTRKPRAKGLPESTGKAIFIQILGIFLSKTLRRDFVWRAGVELLKEVRGW